MTIPAKPKPILAEVAEILARGYLRLLAEQAEDRTEQSTDHRQDRLDYLGKDEASCDRAVNSER
ncbi:MAG: hypothetical protein H6807_15120 [Planctomycetes bacterium]|nr:hypothetical protein [Planctomycetota bacterium]